MYVVPENVQGVLGSRMTCAPEFSSFSVESQQCGSGLFPYPTMQLTHQVLALVPSSRDSSLPHRPGDPAL